MDIGLFRIFGPYDPDMNILLYDGVHGVLCIFVGCVPERGVAGLQSVHVSSTGRRFPTVSTVVVSVHVSLGCTTSGFPKCCFFVGGCPVFCRVFGGISGLYPLSASSTLPHQLWQQKCPQALWISPWGWGGGANCPISLLWGLSFHSLSFSLFWWSEILNFKVVQFLVLVLCG